jgi:opacity protein-like surface antigen
MNKCRVILALICCMLSGQGLAAGDNPWFITGQFGSNEYETVLEGAPDADWWSNVDDRGRGLALGLGYELTSGIAIRAMYERASGIEASNRCPPDRVCTPIRIIESANIDSLSLVVMPRHHFDDTWSIYATVGLHYWRIKPEGQFPDGSDTSLLLGAGVEYRFPNRFRLGGETQGSPADYRAFRVSLGYAF